MARSKKSFTDKYKAPFAVRLRKLMKDRDITQDALAQKIDKTRQTVSQYVNGDSEPGYATLVKIADFFQVSTDYLLGRTGTKSADISKQAVMKYTGLSEVNVSSLHYLVENTQGTLQVSSDECFLYVDGCRLVLDCFNDLFDALMGSRENADKIARYYLRLRQEPGRIGEYEGDSCYLNTKKAVFPGLHSEDESNIIVEHSCVKIGRQIELELKKKYMGNYLDRPDSVY